MIALLGRILLVRKISWTKDGAYFCLFCFWPHSFFFLENYKISVLERTHRDDLVQCSQSYRNLLGDVSGTLIHLKNTLEFSCSVCWTCIGKGFCMSAKAWNATSLFYKGRNRGPWARRNLKWKFLGFPFCLWQCLYNIFSDIFGFIFLSLTRVFSLNKSIVHY